jgi:hypothetical protein
MSHQSCQMGQDDGTRISSLASRQQIMWLSQDALPHVGTPHEGPASPMPAGNVLLSPVQVSIMARLRAPLSVASYKAVKTPSADMRRLVSGTWCRFVTSRTAPNHEYFLLVSALSSAERPETGRRRVTRLTGPNSVHPTMPSSRLLTSAQSSHFNVRKTRP